MRARRSAATALVAASATAVGYVRTLLGAGVVSRNRGDTIIVPIKDDAFAPALCCGEFAIVDTSDTWPEEGGLFYRRSVTPAPGQSQHLSFVEVSQPHLDGRMPSISLSGEPERSWYLALGYIGQLGSVEWATKAGIATRGNAIRMGDGFMSESNLRDVLVGRVIGVLGSEGRAVRWREE